MRILATYAAVCLFCAAAFAQKPGPKVFHFVNLTAADYENAATVIRTTVAPEQVSVQAEDRTLTVTGAPADLAMTAWLFPLLDRSQSASPDATVHEYPATDSTGEIVRVFYFTHASDLNDFQTFHNVIRTMAEIRRTGGLPSIAAMAIRGTATQVSLAAWLVQQIDRPTPQPSPAFSETPASYAYPTAGRPDDLFHIVHCPYGETPQSFQEAANSVRTIADMPYVFPLFSQRALVLRSEAARLTLSEWILKEITTNPISAPATSRTDSFDFRADQYGNTSVRVFFLAPASIEHMRDVTNSVRTTEHIQRAFPAAAHNALVVRGTPGQMAAVEQLVTGK